MLFHSSSKRSWAREEEREEEREGGREGGSVRLDVKERQSVSERSLAAERP